MDLRLEPLGDRVVVEREDAEVTTAGGIVLVDDPRDGPQRGRVLAVGPGEVAQDGRRIAPRVGVGERVLFGAFAGDEFKVDGRKVLLMREDDLLALIIAPGSPESPPQPGPGLMAQAGVKPSGTVERVGTPPT